MDQMHQLRRMALGAVVSLALGSFAATVGSAESNAGARPGLYDSVWPHGRSDAWRTGAARGVGLPIRIGRHSLKTKSVVLPTAPVWGVVYADDAVFVVGGTPFLLEQFTYATKADAGTSLSKRTLAQQALKAALVRPYIAKIDPKTMSVIDIVRFPRGDTLNYVSGVLIHENGKIYTLATSRLYEIDPVTMKVRTLALPKFNETTGGTAYNTLQVAPKTGDIIVKAANLLDQTLPSILVSVKTSDLSIRFQSAIPIGATRIALAVQGRTEYIYASNRTMTLRVAIENNRFTLDTPWSKVYRKDGDGTQPAVSMVYMGNQNQVVFPNNNTVIYGVTRPLRIYTQPTDTTGGRVRSVKANSAVGAGGSFYAASADPFNTKIVVENDQINGIITGWRLKGDGTLTKIWAVNRYRSTGGTAIGVNQKHFYLDDRRCDGTGCRLYLVVLDLMTGRKLSEARVAGSGPTIGQIFLAKDEVFFIATEPGDSKGFVTRVSVK